MGGRVGLKGTDDVVELAIELGGRPSAAGRAERMLAELAARLARAPRPFGIDWLTCAGEMGAASLERAGFVGACICHRPATATTSRTDTQQAVRAFLEHGAEIVVFCGGDGTARDVASVTGLQTPVLGVPGGVKMYSGVFANDPERAARLLLGWLGGVIGAARVELLDLDEDRYRQGEWVVRLFAEALTPFEPSVTQSAKARIEEREDRAARDEIAEHLGELIRAEPEALYLLGPGSTVASIAAALGVEKTLLGVDAVQGGRRVGADLNERAILELLDRHAHRRLVLSPLGAAGFVLGRGNQQLSPRVIAAVGRRHLIVVATPAKLARTPALRFDTGDLELDRELAGDGFLPVVVGYRVRRLVRVD
jgi:predicted polyphosphate/ATP-dependent NAD kinase